MAGRGLSRGGCLGLWDGIPVRFSGGAKAGRRKRIKGEQEFRPVGRSTRAYRVDTPRARVRATRAQWKNLSWQKIKDTVEVKLFREDKELYVVGKSDRRR